MQPRSESSIAFMPGSTHSRELAPISCNITMRWQFILTIVARIRERSLLHNQRSRVLRGHFRQTGPAFKGWFQYSLYSRPFHRPRHLPGGRDCTLSLRSSPQPLHPPSRCAHPYSYQIHCSRLASCFLVSPLVFLHSGDLNMDRGCKNSRSCPFTKTAGNVPGRTENSGRRDCCKPLVINIVVLIIDAFDILAPNVRSLNEARRRGVR
ncbi:hypothetical protein DFH07DRAFT_571732 [Mycena maculata]|uniref:Uncharacterized protein n=1 Tax=Mycena maculata TaxID=230809 RepID=A0AAD7K3Z7_9AGAR|nr:hypothetical protein DFH07DRAFT_571732 [Mycena maculata]